MTSLSKFVCRDSRFCIWHTWCMNKSSPTSRQISRISLIAALYAALTALTMTVFQSLAWGPVQFRLSEAVCVLALFTPEAIPGLAIGCFLANLFGVVLNGSGLAGLFDVAFGSLATLLGALWTWRFRDRKAMALSGPVLTNSLIVAAYLPFIMAAAGFYSIPLLGIDLSGMWLAMYLFGAVSIALGEAAVMYLVGLPLSHLLKTAGLIERIQPSKPPVNDSPTRDDTLV